MIRRLHRTNKGKEYKIFLAKKFGEKAGIEREDGTWKTVKWLICKESAHLENGRLIADSEDAKELFDKLGAVPKHIEGNRFEGKNRENSREGKLIFKNRKDAERELAEKLIEYADRATVFFPAGN